MCLAIKLEGELGDQRDLLNENCILVDLIERSFHENREKIRLLDFIDLYGNTVFNRIQMSRLEEEVQALHEFAQKQE